MSYFRDTTRKSPPNIDGMTSLKVGNISYRTRTLDLHQIFGKFGKVGDVYIPRDKISKHSRGFAFVRYYDKRDAEDALNAMDGKTLDGRELRVQMARYGRPTSPYRSRGRRHRRRSRSRSHSRRRTRSRSYSRSRSRSRRRSYSRSRSRSPSDSRSRSLSRSDESSK